MKSEIEESSRIMKSEFKSKPGFLCKKRFYDKVLGINTLPSIKP